jgi:hypothetical protein
MTERESGHQTGFAVASRLAQDPDADWMITWTVNFPDELQLIRQKPKSLSTEYALGHWQ